MIIRKILNCWLRQKRSGFYLFLAFVWAGIYFTGAMMTASPLSVRLKRLGFLGALGLVLVCFVHMNLHENHWFVDHFKNTDHLPRRQIAHVNSFCMTLFLGISLVVMPAAAYGMEPLWEALYLWFRAKSRPGQPAAPDLHMEMEPVHTPDLTELFGEPKPTPAWMEMLDRIVRAAGMVLIILFFLMILRGICRRVWAWITKPRHFDDDEKIYLTPTWALSSGPKQAVRKKPRLRLSSYNDRIRRQYRREILSRAKRRKVFLSFCASPTELEEAAGLSHPVLHELYEKARYGREECTKEDMEKIMEGNP